MNVSGTILLIEDDEVTNFYNEHILRKHGVDQPILKALNGKEAIELLSEEGDKPGLILMDLHMPVMDGWEFLEAYEQLPEEKRGSLIYVMLTNPLSPDQKEKASGFSSISGFLDKPLNVAKLTEAIPG